MSILDQIFPKKATHKRQIATPPDPPQISMDTFYAYKDRLLEHYQKDPKFHAIVERFHASMQDGSITSEALFDAIFLAKEIFIGEKESRIFSDLVRGRQHGKETL